MAQIATIGLWHLGCVASAGLASLGHTVRATDPDVARIRSLQNLSLPINEPGLEELTAEQVKRGALMFVESASEAFAKADHIFITFDTPVDENDQSDLRPLEAALKEIAAYARDNSTIVVMSQVPVGTCARFSNQLQRISPRSTFNIVYQPENLRLGQALATFLRPDLLVVGSENAVAAQAVLGLYADVETVKVCMGTNSAEMTKHALNAFLATSVSFANEMADLAEVSGADIRSVVAALRLDPRIGAHAFLSPGPGFSGGTLGRDLQTLRGVGVRGCRKTPQLDATVAVNESRLGNFLKKLKREFGTLEGTRIGLLGLTYKPGTDTLRRSRSLELARMLLAAGASVRAFDPMIKASVAELPGIEICADVYRAVQGTDAAILMTCWPEFQGIDLRIMRASMRHPRLIDFHNFIDPAAARNAGMPYWGVGIPDHAEPVAQLAIGAKP